MKNNDEDFRRRARKLLWCILAWAALAAGWLFYYSVFARRQYLELGNKLALRQGVYYAGRGRILDKNNRALAWSEKYFDLYLLGQADDPNIRALILRKVTEILPDASPRQLKDTVFVLKREVPPDKMLALEMLLRRFPDLKIMPRLERKVVDYEAVRNYVGQVEMKDGNQRGISGVEKEWDGALAGSAGIYEVMLDRHRNWISGAWRLKRNAEPGKDVKLPLSIEEIDQLQDKP